MKHLLILLIFTIQLSAGELYDRAIEFEDRIKKHHLEYGQIRVTLYHTTKMEKTKRHLKGVDGAIWTGTYLASLAFHYSIEPSKELLSDIEHIISAMEKLSKASGHDGIICRRFYKGEPAKKGHCSSPTFKGFSYEARPSRDQISGYLYGLAAVKRYVPNKNIHQRIKMLSKKIIDGIYSKKLPWGGSKWSHWTIKHPFLKTTIRCSSSFKTFLCAMGKYLAESDFYAKLYDKQLTLLKRVKYDLFNINSVFARSEYYSNNLRFMRYSSILMFEKNELYRQVIGKRFLKRFRYLATHGNAYFSWLMQLYVPRNLQTKFYKYFKQEQINKEANFSLKHLTHKKLTAFYPNNRNRFIIPVLYEILLKGMKYLLKGSSPPRMQALNPIPMNERIYSIFIWQKPPYTLDHKKNKDIPTLRAPGIDYTVAYWLGRMTKNIKKSD